MVAISAVVFTLCVNSSPPGWTGVNEGRKAAEEWWGAGDGWGWARGSLCQIRCEGLCSVHLVQRLESTRTGGVQASPPPRRHSGPGLPSIVICPSLSLLHPAICLEETHFLPPHSSSLHYPPGGAGGKFRRGGTPRVRGVSMSEPKCWGVATISSIKRYLFITNETYRI